MPECTMEELAQAVREYPELGTMTLHELLARVRRRDDLEARLGAALDELVRPLPALRIRPAARERIARTGIDIISPVVEIARAAKRRGVGIMRLVIEPESLGPDDVTIAFEIGPHPRRQAMWEVVERMSTTLPANLWLGLC